MSMELVPSPPAEPKPEWERKKGESSRQYDAFLYYLKLGPRRSYNQVTKEIPQANWRWWSKWRWEERAEAFDAHISATQLARIEAERLEMNQRQAEVGRDLLAFAHDRLQQFKEHPSKVTAKEAAEIAKIGAALERSALGEPRKAREAQQGLEALLLQVNVDASPKEVTD